MNGTTEDISAKYATELTELKFNSKPLINSLTMMAEDYIRHAPVVVQTIENHLKRVKPELKLPVLYLIDSIVKNVKKDYVELFTQNIVSTFAKTFEQVPEKIRTQMWKLRQTWNDVFSTKKLYSIDFKCHQTDPGWPITAAPPSTSNIHVNPKFLARAFTISPATTTTQSPLVVSTIASPSLLPTTSTIAGLPSSIMGPTGDITEARMKEQLLIIQKELLELQTRKLELELLQTVDKSKRSSSKDKDKSERSSSKDKDKSERSSSKDKDKAERSTSKDKDKSERSGSKDKEKSERSGSKDKDKSERSSSKDKDAKRSSSKDKDSKRSNSKGKSSSSTSSSSSSSRRKNDSPTTTTTTSTNSVVVGGSSSSSVIGKSSSPKELKEGRDSKGKSSSSSSSRRRGGDTLTSSSSVVGSGSVVGKSSPKEPKEGRDSTRKRAREDYKTRKSAVLQRNYRRQTEVSAMEDEEGLIMLGANAIKKDKDSHGKGKSDYRQENISGNSKSAILMESDDLLNPGKGLINDIDLRFDGLKDVDLRNEASGGGGVMVQGNSGSIADQPPMKKARNSGSTNLIIDLFGREDIDLRQPAAGNSWSQVKRTQMIAEGGSIDNEMNMKPERRTPQQQQQDEKFCESFVGPYRNRGASRSGQQMMPVRGRTPYNSQQQQQQQMLPQGGPFRGGRGGAGRGQRGRGGRGGPPMMPNRGRGPVYNNQQQQRQMEQMLPQMDKNFGGPFRGGRGGPPMFRGRGPMYNNQPMGFPSMGNNPGEIRMPHLPPNSDSIVPLNDAFHPRLLQQFESNPHSMDISNMMPPNSDSIVPLNDAFHPRLFSQFESNPNTMGMLSNMMPSSGELDVPIGGGGDPFRGNNSNNNNNRAGMENPYPDGGGDSSMLGERVENKTEQNANKRVAGSPMDVHNLLARLMKAGLLPSAIEEKMQETIEEEEDKTIVDSETGIKDEGGVKQEEEDKMDLTLDDQDEVKIPETIPMPPVEVVDVTFDKLKERRDKLIEIVCSGVQCGSCGLRFPPDQAVRYSQHLDWHFRQNRRDKANVRKAQSRKWYYDLSDWIQFTEVEDLEERAQSLFESQDMDIDGEVRSPGFLLNPDMYTVLAAGHDGAICPQCNEGFDSFFDGDKEEWRLRDAFLAENVEENTMTLYHPICHQDYVALLQGKSMLTKVEEPPMPVEPTVPLKLVDDEDEVLILKEGKPEVVVMDIDVEAEEEEEMKNTTPTTVEEKLSSGSSVSQSQPTEIDLIDDEQIDSVIEKDSGEQNETICIHDDDDNNGVVDISLNNKNETSPDLQQNVDSSSISHNNNSKSTNTKIDDTSIITLRESGEDDTLLSKNSNINIPTTSNNNNKPTSTTTTITTTTTTTTTSNNNNISVNVLSSIGTGGGSKVGGGGPDSPTLVMIDDEDTSDREFFASIPGISDKSVFNIALSSGKESSSDESRLAFKPIIYESMKFDVPTPRIKIEPPDPDENPQSDDILSLDDIIKANMADDAQDGMDSVEQSGPVPSTEVTPDAKSDPNLVDIDLTGDDELSSESNLVAGSAALDGNNFLLETVAVSVLPKPVVVCIDNASLKPRNESSKPRLSGRKLVNCPVKESGKEVSGLCTIC